MSFSEKNLKLWKQSDLYVTAMINYESLSQIHTVYCNKNNYYYIYIYMCVCVCVCACPYLFIYDKKINAYLIWFK